MPRADEIRRRWREAAPGWQRYDALLHELTEPVGGESHLHMRLNSGQLVVLEVHGRPSVAEGETRALHLPISSLHCFAADGRRAN